MSIDGTSLFHEAKAAGVIYQATLRREMNRSYGFEWETVDPSTGMAEIAGVRADSIRAWSQRSSQLREWAADNLAVVDGPLSAAQLAAAQKATRPPSPKSWPGPSCKRSGARTRAVCSWTAPRTARTCGAHRRGARPG